MASDSDWLRDFKGFRHAPKTSKPTIQLKPPTMFDNFPDSVLGFTQFVTQNFLAPFTEFPSKIGQAGKSLTRASGVQAPLTFSSMLVSDFSWPQPRSSLSPGDDNNNSSIDNNNNNNNNNNAARDYPSRKRNSAVARLPSDGIDWGSERGPAFLGQVFSVVNPSGTGLIPVNSGADPPFLRRAPKWIKKIFALVTKNDMKGPVFPFFLDIGDAVRYMKRLNIQSGMVGACRLDLAYEYFREKPQLFQFVPNEKQVKEANKILQRNSKGRGANQLKGVPVFTAQNLSIVIATIKGVRWYTPYFFDKKLLDNMLEVSIDQHFQWLIHNRYIRRRKEMVDDDFPPEMIEEHFESLLDPPEVQELMEEIGQAGVPLNSVISKAAEICLYDAVDRVLLGNRWMRKVTGIQPKIPFKVDSFEERTAASVSRSREQSIGIKPDLKGELDTGASEKSGASNSSLLPEFNSEEKDKADKSIRESSQHSQSSGAVHEEGSSKFEPREPALDGGPSEQDLSDHILPKITIVSIFTSEPSQINNASMKKTMEELAREIDEKNQRKNEFDEDKDPLFVANVGEFAYFESPRSVFGERK